MQVIARMNQGGTARYLELLAGGLLASGVESLLATGHVQDPEAEDSGLESIPYVRIPHLGRRIALHTDLHAARELAAAIRAFQPDVIHTHTFKAGAIGRLIAPGVPHVHTFHGHLFDDPEFAGWRGAVVVALERGLAHRSSQLVTVGSQVAKDLLSRGIGSPEQYVSIPPGVPNIDRTDRARARAILAIDPGAVVIAWLARVTSVKNPRRVVELARAFPQATFLLGGSGDLLDVMRAEAPANLRILGWADPSHVYGAADIALSTSHNEGMPVSLIEAQLAGLPVVATDVGSVGEVVEDGVTGRLVHSMDLEAALGSLIEDQGLRQTMGAAGYERARRLFSPEAMVKAHIDVYERVLAEHRRN